MSRKAVGTAVLVIGLWALIGAIIVIHRQALSTGRLIAFLITLLLVAGGAVLLVQSRKKPKVSKICVGGVLLGCGLFTVIGLTANLISPNKTQGPDAMIGLMAIGLTGGGIALIVQGIKNKKNNNMQGEEK